MSKVRKVVLPLLVVGLSVGAFVLMIKFRRKVEALPVESPPPAVQVVALEREDYPIRIRSQGTIEAAVTVRLISEVDGKTVGISPGLEKGGFFTKGEVLVALDSRDYSLAVTRAEAQVAAAQLRVATVEAEAKIAMEDWEELGKDREASALLLRQPQLVDARSALAAAEADLSRAKLDLERTKIRAPFDGRVRAANVDVGQVIRRGEELASIFGIDRVEVSLPLPLAELEYLDLPVERTPEAFRVKPTKVSLTGRFGRQEYQWQGRVVRIGGEVDTDSRMVSVVVSIEKPYSSGATTAGPPLRVGMFVEAEIEGRTAKGVYVVPRVQLWENSRALAVDQQGRLRIRELQLLRADRERAVIESGFEPGDRLCVSAIDIPADGLEVRVVEAGEGGLE